ncbi:hypothetical protein C8Q75DRAFT_727611, partial [Abortiporus biennis]
TSPYISDLSQHMYIFPTFHFLLLKPYYDNNFKYFPSRHLSHLAPIITDNRVKE